MVQIRRAAGQYETGQLELTQSNSPRSGARRLARGGSVVALVVIVATAMLLPVAERPLGEIKPFLPMFATTVVITEYLTAYMLYTHFRSSRMAYLAALASASVFVAMAAVQVTFFPGVFSETGLLGAGAQSAVWIWTLAWWLPILRPARALAADASGRAAAAASCLVGHMPTGTRRHFRHRAGNPGGG